MPFGHRGAGRKAIATAGQRLVADIEAFLSGRYEQHLLRHLDVVPTWARLNTLAHGTVEDLHDAVLDTTPTSGSAPRRLDRWESARRVLAIDLLAIVRDDPAVLGQVQHAVLVPLELHLMQNDPTDGMNAYELVQITRAALRSIII